MELFHVNVGHWLTKPYESDYNMWRRLILVNPGTPTLALRQNLSRRLPDIRSRSEKVRALQLPNRYLSGFHRRGNNLEISRQCPKCAQILYHCDLYELPWITRCPIHNIELVTRCPVCSKPWPVVDEINHRDCQCCGRLLDIQGLPISDHARASKSYLAIGEIDDLLAAAKPDFLKIRSITDISKHRETRDPNQDWWKTGDVSNNLYPSFLAATSNNRNAVGVIAKLGIGTNGLRVRSTRLKLVGYNSPHWFRDYMNEMPQSALPEFSGDNSVSKSSHQTNRVIFSPNAISISRSRPGELRYQLRDEYVTMRRIVAWIKNTLTEKHSTHLVYGFPYGCQPGDSPSDFFPYCRALSIWFGEIVSHMFPEGYNPAVGRRQSFWGNFYFIPDVFYPYFKTGNRSILEEDAIYASSRGFASWFYRRGLEVLFISLLRGMIATSLFYHYRKMNDEEAANIQINKSGSSAESMGN